MRKRNLSRIDMSSNIYHHTHLRPAFINTAIQRRTPPNYAQNLHKNRADRTHISHELTRRTSRTNPQSHAVQRRIRSTKQPIRSAKRHQTAQPQPPREPPSPTAHRTAPNPSRRAKFSKPITAHARVAASKNFFRRIYPLRGYAAATQPHKPTNAETTAKTVLYCCRRRETGKRKAVCSNRRQEGGEYNGIRRCIPRKAL